MDTVPSSTISLEEFVGTSRLNGRLTNAMAGLEQSLDLAVKAIEARDARIAELEAKYEPKEEASLKAVE